jgi:hypothetical protein
MSTGILCQSCGVEAPTKYVEFYHNIGLLVMRFHRTAKGHFCKRCIHGTFWKYQGINVTVGWWGMVSLVVTPIFIINNLVRYLGALSLEPVPPGAAVPELSAEAIALINPHAQELFGRLHANENFETVARDVSVKAGVTPGQVVRYLFASMARAQEAPTFAAPSQPTANGATPPPPLPAQNVPVQSLLTQERTLKQPPPAPQHDDQQLGIS